MAQITQVCLNVEGIGWYLRKASITSVSSYLNDGVIIGYRPAGAQLVVSVRAAMAQPLA